MLAWCAHVCKGLGFQNLIAKVPEVESHSPEFARLMLDSGVLTSEMTSLLLFCRGSQIEAGMILADPLS
ncbi:hypothetical protein [Thalassoglobus polymorphus]|uniref:hypothetical protein n=1 Tax=Thalassoglobus polymorphus TaxID=2527994 RepID=UPI00119FC483|nr:hypothetical protein [Thalassoglobus polymorphus]